MEELRPNEQRASIAIVLIWLVSLMEGISLFSNWLQYDFLDQVANGIEIVPGAAEANDMRVSAIAITYLVVYIISVITFILWFRRAYYNLHLTGENLSFSEGWAAGSWFVPIMSLFRPFQIMKELYAKTKELLVKNGLTSDDDFSPAALGWWWALWILNNFMGQFEFRYSRNADAMDEFFILTVSGMVGNVLGIVLGIITVKVIKDYSKKEHLLNEIRDDDTTTDFHSSHMQPDIL